MRHGEKRIFIDAEICPELRNGMLTAMSWIRQWYGPELRLVRIEAKTQTRLPTRRTSARAGLFLSGGIDSLSSLRSNRLNFPLEHPGSFKDGLLIHGIEKGKDLELYKHVFSSLSEIAQDAKLNLIPVYTNVRQLDDDNVFWGDQFLGAALSAVAHAFSRRLNAASIPATYDLRNLVANGSHPLLDPNYSSSDLQIRHDGILLSRLSKTELVADWDVALQNVRVCNNPKKLMPGALNCGQCEKCLRTKLALLALGKLDKTRAFPKSDTSEELLLAEILARTSIATKPSTGYQASCYREIAVALAANGHRDLARNVERFLARSNAKIKRKQTKERLKQIDCKFLNGSVLKLYKAIGQRA